MGLGVPTPSCVLGAAILWPMEMDGRDDGACARWPLPYPACAQGRARADGRGGTADLPPGWLLRWLWPPAWSDAEASTVPRCVVASHAAGPALGKLPGFARA